MGSMLALARSRIRMHVYVLRLAAYDARALNTPVCFAGLLFHSAFSQSVVVPGAPPLAPTLWRTQLRTLPRALPRGGLARSKPRAVAGTAVPAAVTLDTGAVASTDVCGGAPGRAAAVAATFTPAPFTPTAAALALALAAELGEVGPSDQAKPAGGFNGTAALPVAVPVALPVALATAPLAALRVASGGAAAAAAAGFCNSFGSWPKVSLMSCLIGSRGGAFA